MRKPPALAVLALGAAIGAAACAESGPRRSSYINANKTVFRELPVFPGAQFRKDVSAPARAGEDGSVVGYTTLFYFDLPRRAQAGDVAAFYELRLQPRWRLVERLDGPVLNFRRGASFVSVNLESWRGHVLEVAVDHGR